MRPNTQIVGNGYVIDRTLDSGAHVWKPFAMRFAINPQGPNFFDLHPLEAMESECTEFIPSLEELATIADLQVSGLGRVDNVQATLTLWAIATES